jgi:TonB family protein
VTRNLVKSGLLSIGVHSFLMIPVAIGMARSVGPETDVLSGLSSVELELVAPESPSTEGEEEIQTKSRPAPPQEEWLNDSGALSDAQPLSPFRNAAPPYPRLARVQGWQGTVLVRAWVAPSGGVASVRVAESSGRGILDQAAAAAVQGWKFRPARRKGQAVASTVDVPITFQLKQKTGQQGED